MIIFVNIIISVYVMDDLKSQFSLNVYVQPKKLIHEEAISKGKTRKCCCISI